MIIIDDRTAAQRSTHTLGIVMTDRVLSNWAHAKEGPSYAVWACKAAHRIQIERWVKSNRTALRVREVSLQTYRPRGPGHCHIYIVTDGHPALI